MLGRTTRLEFIIVTVAFLVLLLCSKPPQPGSANVDILNSPGPLSQDAPVVPLLEEPTPPIEVNQPQPVGLEEPTPDAPDSQTDSEPQAAEPAQPLPRLATVDARNCDGLNYDRIMQGKITVRWVWDGQRLAPQKVCVVKGPDGTSTVWGFDQQGNAVLAEIETPADSNP